VPGVSVRLNINGVERELQIESSRLLLDVLRADLGLTGTKRACEDGSCGACTVLVNGKPQMACLMLAASCLNCAITTIEGLGTPDQMTALQRAFAEEGGAQCGFCTPGMILSAHSLLADTPDPSEAQLREALAGNLCRCTGYTQILKSVHRAIEWMRERHTTGVAG
jgi:carbon-monoxide dehydrogenase small subunit